MRAGTNTKINECFHTLSHSSSLHLSLSLSHTLLSTLLRISAHRMTMNQVLGAGLSTVPPAPQPSAQGFLLREARAPKKHCESWAAGQQIKLPGAHSRSPLPHNYAPAGNLALVLQRVPYLHISPFQCPPHRESLRVAGSALRDTPRQQLLPAPRSSCGVRPPGSLPWFLSPALRAGRNVL